MKVISRILGVMILIGLIMSVVAFFMGLDPLDLKGFFTDEEAYGEMITLTHDDEISELILDLSTRHIVIHYVEENELTMTYYEHEEKDTWTIDESVPGTYKVTHREKIRWLNFISFKFTPKEIVTVHVYIPETWVVGYDLSTNTGSIRMMFDETYDVLNLDLHTNTGDIYVDGVSGGIGEFVTDTGDITLKNVVLSSTLFVDSDTGDLRLEDVDTTDLDLSTDTGNVIMTGINGNVCDIDVDTGSISITNSLFTSSMKLHTDTGNVNLTEVVGTAYDLSSSTGDVIFTLADSSNLYYDFKTDTGNIKVDGASQGTRHSTTQGTILLKVNVDTGNIRINS